MPDKPIHAKPAIYAHYYEQLKVIAQQYGYCLLIHGSMNRDLDLVAVPWKNGAHECDVKKMIEEMGAAIGSEDIMPPHPDSKIMYGREQWVINIHRGGYFHHKDESGNPIYMPDPQFYIDVSVFPAILKDSDNDGFKQQI